MKRDHSSNKVPYARAVAEIASVELYQVAILPKAVREAKRFQSGE